MVNFRLVDDVFSSAQYINGIEWNKQDASALVYILRNLCSSKFSLSSFLDIGSESFRFAQTGYVQILKQFQIVEDVALDLYRSKVIPFIKRVETQRFLYQIF
jgi:hypothetical protein